MKTLLNLRRFTEDLFQGNTIRGVYYARTSGRKGPRSSKFEPVKVRVSVSSFTSSETLNRFSALSGNVQELKVSFSSHNAFNREAAMYVGRLYLESVTDTWEVGTDYHLQGKIRTNFFLRERGVLFHTQLPSPKEKMKPVVNPSHSFGRPRRRVQKDAERATLLVRSIVARMLLTGELLSKGDPYPRLELAWAYPKDGEGDDVTLNAKVYPSSRSKNDVVCLQGKSSGLFDFAKKVVDSIRNIRA